MKNVSNWIIGAVAAIGVIAIPAWAYNDTITHPELTHTAFEKSNLALDPALLQRLGLEPWQKSWIDIWLRVGAWYEDRGSRGMQHFFDPTNNKGLSFVGVEVGNPSPRWVLEDESQISGQTTSVADAREQLTRALTYNDGTPSQSYQERQASMGNFFIYLAAAVHHLQDMTQPQHVRNDDHLDEHPILLFPLYDPSLYERYTKQRIDHVQEYGQMGSPVFPGTAGLKKAGDFWTNPSNTGVAQFTNPRFVTKGTNFWKILGFVTAGKYSNPTPGTPVPYTVEKLYQDSNLPVPDEIQALCGYPAVGCTMMEYPASYGSFTTQKASTHSIFDQDLNVKGLSVTYTWGNVAQTYSTERVFALNRFNFDAVHQPLLSTAVSYSAGFLNHFFRGKLEVGPPQAGGPYAAVDHQTGQGFTTLRAKVTNRTKDEALQGGTITAIARFHVNNCYQADLTGEFQADEAGNLITPCAQYRSSEEHIRLSVSQPFSFGPDAGKDYTFEFPTPIPLNATDLVLQVYYQGQVGDEKGSFALGVVDLSEPTFVSVLNGTDMFEVPTSPVGTFVYWQDILSKIDQYPYTTVDENHDLVPDVNVAGGSIAYTISVENKQIAQVALPEGRFSRLAVLVQPTTFKLTLAATGNGFFGSSDWTMPAKIGQLDPTDGVYYVSVVEKRRKQALHYVNITYYHYYKTANAPLSSMNVSKDPDATTLVGVYMMPQSTSLASLAPQPDASTATRPSALELPRVDFPTPRPVERVAPAGSGRSQLLASPLEESVAAEAR